MVSLIQREMVVGQGDGMAMRRRVGLMEGLAAAEGEDGDASDADEEADGGFRDEAGEWEVGCGADDVGRGPAWDEGGVERVGAESGGERTEAKDGFHGCVLGFVNGNSLLESMMRAEMEANGGLGRGSLSLRVVGRRGEWVRGTAMEQRHERTEVHPDQWGAAAQPEESFGGAAEGAIDGDYGGEREREVVAGV